MSHEKNEKHEKSKSKRTPLAGDAITYTTPAGAGPWPGKVVAEPDETGLYLVKIDKPTGNSFRCAAAFGDEPGSFQLASH